MRPSAASTRSRYSRAISGMSICRRFFTSDWRKRTHQPRHPVLERLAEHVHLRLRRHARRLEEELERRIRLHRSRHVRDHAAPAAQVPRLAREGEQRLRVVPGDRRLAHRATGSPRRRSASRWRGSSRSAGGSPSGRGSGSITLPAPAMARSTASLRSWAIAFAFSAAISARARSSIFACSACACSTSSVRTRSAAARASAMSFWPSPREASSAALCCESRSAASSRSRFAALIAVLERLLPRLDGGGDRLEGVLRRGSPAGGRR